MDQKLLILLLIELVQSGFKIFRFLDETSQNKFKGKQNDRI